MAQKTSISWTDQSWNPVTGCSHVSPGCTNCYAEALSLRFKRSAHPWGAQWAAENVVLHPERLDQPLKWRKPQKVFVNSMSDLFHEQIPDEFIDRVFAVMALTPWHTYQILTKRPKRMHEYFTRQLQGPLAGRSFVDRLPETDVHHRVFEKVVMACTTCPPAILNRAAEWHEKRDPEIETFFPCWPLPNVWLGVSVEDQRRADERIPLLLRTPAAVRFLSCEPLLGPLEISRYLGSTLTDLIEWENPAYQTLPWPLIDGIDWVIVGGESGPRFRPMNPDWARSIRNQCQATQAALWFKQGSGIRPQMNETLDGQEWHQFPEARHA